MEVEFITKVLKEYGVDFFTGVPDSQLKPFCDYILDVYGVGDRHIIAANEGNAVGLAAGNYLATGNISCVYLQNSGIGNIINPVASLLNDKIYGIPCVFIVGWRGEPEVYDEPQHLFQGEITLKLLETMDIKYMIIDGDTSEEDLLENMLKFKKVLNLGKSIAFVVKKGGLSYCKKTKYRNKNSVLREDIIKHIVKFSQEDIIVSTTGKTSRELFEIRESNGESHKYDFLTIGSMGHSSSIALGIALNKLEKRVFCIDGDGSILMHMGSMAVIAKHKPRNFIHIAINNGAHESVGGMPTVADNMNFRYIALGMGYEFAYTVNSLEELSEVLTEIQEIKGVIFIEIKSAIGSREDLGRPFTTPKENKVEFMSYLKGEC